jgi:predicted homoserine dehydrogenase-like protein
MQGPEARHVKDVFKCFNLDDLWRTKKPVVDYILGAEPGGGVFVIGYCENAYQREMLAYYKMGSGPYYLFYRPYHLCHIEAMRTVIEAVTAGQHLLVPDWGFETNVFAYAKTNLRAGTVLDGIGGYCCYGKIENHVDNQDKPGLPICLADDVRVKRNIVKDEKIFLDDVVYNPLRSDFALYSQARESSATIRLSLNDSDG